MEPKETAETSESLATQRGAAGQLVQMPPHVPPPSGRYRQVLRTPVPGSQIVLIPGVDFLLPSDTVAPEVDLRRKLLPADPVVDGVLARPVQAVTSLGAAGWLR